MPDPRSIYTQRLEERRADLAVRERRHHLLGNLQLAVVPAVWSMVVAALAYRAFSIAWVAVPAAVFVAFLMIHDRLLRMAEFRRRAVRYFERALARLDGQWAGTGETGQSYLDPAHPYAQDLDLFGKGSLFELLCTARTHIGEDTLARWLLEPGRSGDGARAPGSRGGTAAARGPAGGSRRARRGSAFRRAPGGAGSLGGSAGAAAAFRPHAGFGCSAWLGVASGAALLHLPALRSQPGASSQPSPPRCCATCSWSRRWSTRSCFTGCGIRSRPWWPRWKARPTGSACFPKC